MEDVYCYQCNATWAGRPPRTDGDGERLCPACGSEFVEIVPTTSTPQRSTAPAPTQQQDVPQGRHFDQVVTLPGGETATVSVRVITAPMGPPGVSGAQALSGQQLQQALQLHPGSAVFGFHFGGDGDLPQFPINLGDFAGPGSMDQIMAQLAEQHQPARNPAARQVVESLPKREVSPADAEQDPKYASCEPGEPCSVCHCSFSPGETVTELYCQHCFHNDCILPWLDSHNTCPVCRAALPRDVVPQSGADSQHHQPASRAGSESAQVDVQQELGDTQEAALQRATQIIPISSRESRHDTTTDGTPADSTDQPPADDGALHSSSDSPQPELDADHRDAAQLNQALPTAVPPQDGNGNTAGWMGRAASWLVRSAFRRG